MFLTAESDVVYGSKTIVQDTFVIILCILGFFFTFLVSLTFLMSRKSLLHVTVLDIVPLNYLLFYSTEFNYYLEGGRQSCNQICQKHVSRCTSMNHNFRNETILSIFGDQGANCTTGFDTDEYRNTDEPVFVNGWKCLGW